MYIMFLVHICSLESFWGSIMEHCSTILGKHICKAITYIMYCMSNLLPDSKSTFQIFLHGLCHTDYRVGKLAQKLFISRVIKKAWHHSLSFLVYVNRVND